jgi:hypothetical protein
MGPGNQRMQKNFARREGNRMSDQPVNYCQQKQMSICTAENLKQQVACSYFEKSSFAERCMYFIFEEYCDCLTAQLNARRVGGN